MPAHNNADGAQDAALEPYTGQEQDALLRVRLLTEDRQFRRITRKLTYLTAPELRRSDEDGDAPAAAASSSSAPPSKVAAALTSVQLELSTFVHNAKRLAFLASTALPAQQRGYQTQSAVLDEQIAECESKIASLQAELELVRRERSNKLVYDDIARRINAFPTRAELRERLQRLEHENTTLRAEAVAYDELDATARERFRSEVCDRLEQLQRELGDEVGRRERSAVERAQEKGEDVDAELAALEAEAKAEAHPAEGEDEDALAADGSNQYGGTSAQQEEREPGEVEEGEAVSAPRTQPSSTTKSGLRATAPDFTPSGKSRLPRGTDESSRASSPAAAAAGSSRKRPRAAGEGEGGETILSQSQSDIGTSSSSQAAHGRKQPSSSSQAQQAPPSKTSTARPTLAHRLDEETTSTRTSTEEGEHSDDQAAGAKTSRGDEPSRGDGVEPMEEDVSAEQEQDGTPPPAKEGKRGSGGRRGGGGAGGRSASTARRKASAGGGGGGGDGGEGTPPAPNRRGRGAGAAVTTKEAGAPATDSATTASAAGPAKKRRRG